MTLTVCIHRYLTPSSTTEKERYEYNHFRPPTRTTSSSHSSSIKTISAAQIIQVHPGSNESDSRPALGQEARRERRPQRVKNAVYSENMYSVRYHYWWNQFGSVYLTKRIHFYCFRPSPRYLLILNKKCVFVVSAGI